MGSGFCVIGLDRKSQSCCSIRPLPPRGNAWQPFPFIRGDILCFRLSFIPPATPHVEDRVSTGILRKAGHVAEGELVAHLRQAELAENLGRLFNCSVHENPGGSGVYVEPNAASRSICGCDVPNVRFQVFPDAVRVTVLLPSGEALRDLPLVDRDWNEFICRVVQETTGANRLQRINRFFNGVIAERVLNNSNRFVRIGLSRKHNEKHWLMLDSLFPLPQQNWLNQRP